MRAATLALIALALVGCGDEAEEGVQWAPIAYDPADKPPELLSETGLVRWDATTGRLEYHPDAVPYEMATPLFSDYALKERAIWLPAGQPMEWRDKGLLEMPVGTVILKSFLVAADLRQPEKDLRLVETRLLIRKATGWEAWPYIWKDDGSDADRWVSGKVISVSFLDLEGDTRDASYLIPQKNQCLDCHEIRADDGSGKNILVPIGPTARNLDRSVTPGGTNQLEDLAARGLLTGLPSPIGIEAAFDWRQLELPVSEAAAAVSALSDTELDRAARDYLDANCAHCHNPRGVEGVSSQLFLDVATTAPYELGVCKPPGSAGKGGFGREYDIVPGDPDASILIYRLESENPGAMMPDIGRSLAHDQAIALLREWVTRMPGTCAN
ncbi:MAG: SO2930 family diheme c-type cytochrome [Myxococcota bacterium]